MSIQAEHDRTIEVEDYMSGKDTVVKMFNRIKLTLDGAIAFKGKYPDDTTEIDQGIVWIKNQCQNIIDSY